MNDETRILRVALQRMNDRSKLRDKMIAMDDMNHVRWTSAWKNSADKPWWWQDKPSSQPKNDIRAATRMFASVLPVIQLSPLHDNEGTRATANEVEKILLWQYMLAARRGSGNKTYSIVESAFLYGKVCAQLVYLDAQRKINEELGIQSGSVEGDYAILVRHPANVYEDISELYGLQNVLHVGDFYGEDIVASWGAHAKPIQDILDQETNLTQRRPFRVFDWTDDKHRVVMAYDLGVGTSMPETTAPGEMVAGIGGIPSGVSDVITIFNDEHGLPFLNWAIRMRGNEIERRPEDQVSPLLDTVYEGDQWNSMNIWRSAERSATLATLLMPQSESTTISGEAPVITHDVPGGNVAMQTGETYQRLPPPTLDPRIANLKEEDAAEIGEGTVPRIIASPSAPSGAAFATINQMYDAAESTLTPWAEVAELEHDDLFKLMIRYKIHYKDPLQGYDMKLGQRGHYVPTGQQLSIPVDEIPRDYLGEIKLDERGDIVTPYAIYLTSHLVAKLPVDETQRLNGGNILRMLGLPDEYVYESLNIPDPTGQIKKRYMQQYLEAAMGIGLKSLQAQGDAGAQKILQQVQQQMQQNAQPAPGNSPPPPDAQVPPGGPGAGPAGMQPDVAGGPMSGMPGFNGMLNPDQMRQQAEARASAGLGAPPPQLASLVAAAKGAGGNFVPPEGGQSPAVLAPGLVTKEARTGRTRRGKTVRKGK